MKSFAFAFAGLLCFWTFPGCWADDAPTNISIASWNLEWFFDADQGDNESSIAKEQSAPSQQLWEWKLNVVSDAIAKFRPTILCLQEIENRRVLFALTEDLKKRHQVSYRIAFIEGFDKATEQDVAILYQHGLVEFSRKEQTNEQFESQHYYYLSKHLFGKFEWQAGGKTESLTILNVHFRAKAEEAALRRRQSKLVRLWLNERIAAGENVVVVGDTNIEEPFGTPVAGGEMEVLTGKNTPIENDDLFEIHALIPESNRRTHLVLDKQFDRMLVSKSLLEDSPGRVDLVLENADVLKQHCIRGTGPDLDHWETLLTKPLDERDVSDHFPIMATFQFR